MIDYRILVDCDEKGYFYLREITDEFGNVWIVEGECSQCGQCCINPKYGAGYNDKNGRCTKLITEEIDGVEINRCSIYPYRPVPCAIWPRELRHITDNNKCTFKLTKKNN